MSNQEQQNFAVILTGGKQFTVRVGDKVRVPTIEGEPESKVVFSQVLARGCGSDVSFGSPNLDGAKVEAKVLCHDKEKKILVFKKRRRQGYKKKQGHRQAYTEVLIENIA